MSILHGQNRADDTSLKKRVCKPPKESAPTKRPLTSGAKIDKNNQCIFLVHFELQLSVRNIYCRISCSPVRPRKSLAKFFLTTNKRKRSIFLNIPSPNQHIVLSTLTIVASACLLTQACSKSSPTAISSAPSLDTNQAEIVPSIVLGQGYNPVISSPTSDICVSLDGFTSTTHPTEQPYTSFLIEGPADLPFEVERHMRDDVDYADYGTAIDDFYDPYFESRNNEGKFLSVLVSLPTVSKEITAQSVVDLDATCNYEPAESVYEFIDRCGTEFLEAEHRGVLILLVADITNDPEYMTYERVLNSNVVQNTQNIDVDLADLAMAGHDIEWEVLPLTDPGVSIDPSSSILNSNGLLPSSNWNTYVAEIQDKFLNSSGGIKNDEFGEVLRQTFRLYSGNFVEDCGDFSVPSELGCYNKVANAQKRIELSETLTREYQRALWVHDNQSRVEFAATPNNDAATQYSDWISDYETCVEKILPRVMSQCHDALLAEEENLCIYCDIRDVCDPNSLATRAAALPEATIVPIIDESERTDSFDLQDPNTSIDSPIDRICVLSSFHGEFSTGYDRVELVADPPNNQWTLEVGGYGVSGGMNCAEVSKFVDPQVSAGGSLDWYLNSYSNTQTSQQPATSISIGAGTYASAVAGLKGSLRGGGESIDISYGFPSSMQLANQSGTLMEGYATSFGTMNPSAGAPAWSQLDDDDLTEQDLNEEPSYEVLDRAEIKLAPLSESICFLEKISGQFDGSGESVKLLQIDNHWHLRISAGCKVQGSGGFLAQGDYCQVRKDIRARARCYKFDQR